MHLHTIFCVLRFILNCQIRHFEKLANENDISFTQLKKVIKNQCEILPDIVEDVINGFDNKIGKDILSVVQKNCSEITKEF